MPVPLDTVMSNNSTVPVPVGVTVAGTTTVHVGAVARPVPALVIVTVEILPSTTVAVAVGPTGLKVRVIPVLYLRPSLAILIFTSLSLVIAL